MPAWQRPSATKAVLHLLHFAAQDSRAVSPSGALFILQRFLKETARGLRAMGEQTHIVMKTKLNLFAMVLGALLLALPAAVQAQLIFTTNNGAITITGYNGPGGAVVIPATTNGLSVINIGNSAFQNRTNVTSVTIPNSVTNIGDSAFYLCFNLTNLTIGNGVIHIGGYAFRSCYRLRNVTIPDQVTTLGGYAFANCDGLTNLILGNRVASIEGQAFYSCSHLTSMTIPRSVTNIGGGVFNATSRLTTITVDPNNPAYSSAGGVLFDKNQTTLIQCPGGVTAYTIPDGVLNIADLGFMQCFNLESVTIPGSVTNIGNDAFLFCYALGSLTVPKGVISIGANAFQYCSSLSCVTIPQSVLSIGGGSFDNCDVLGAITVDPNNPAYSSVGGILFDKSQTTLIRCPEGLSGCTIPDGVMNIVDEAFAFSYALRSVTIPGSVTNIGNAAFIYCYNLTSVYCKGNAPSLGGSDVFTYDNNVTVYYLPVTTGWSATFGGVPAMLWNPQATTFVADESQFGFNITGPTSATIVVEACTNLTSPVWTPIGTNTLTGGAAYFSDPQWTNYPGRFYRLRSQ